MPAITISSSLTYTTTAGTPVAITITNGTLAFAVTAMGGSGFLAKCQVAMGLVAAAVLMEDGTLANATSRFDYARLVEWNPLAFATNQIGTIAGDGVTDDGATDQAIVNRILGLWDSLSFGA